MTTTTLKTAVKERLTKPGGAPKHKGGAPQKRIKRASGIRVRLTATERFLIESKARQAGMRISDWFRAAALKGKVVARLTPEQNQAFRMLSGLANNFNQMTRQANAGGITSIAIRCGHLLTEIDQVFQYLNSDDGQNS